MRSLLRALSRRWARAADRRAARSTGSTSAAISVSATYPTVPGIIRLAIGFRSVWLAHYQGSVVLRLDCYHCAQNALLPQPT